MGSKRYTIEFRPLAARDLRKLSPSVQQRLAPHIDALALNPRPPGVEELSSDDDYFRIRVGDYRILYSIQDAVLIVLVIRIGHRREIYRKSR